ncbi:MAG: efflux RND transporter periplasmic adaptor subunit [Xanthomonadales bacterium]|nr:efflux RND transporter periplasmic adaptor subunit [Xanthomonadales bacterium]
MTNKGKWWSIFFIALVSTAGFYAWSSESPVRDLDQKPRQSGRVSLGTLTETVIATGVIRPMVGAEVNVGSRISGTVVSLPVEVGDKVEVDQLLAELDDTALVAVTDQVRADVALAKPRVALAESVLKRRQRLAGLGLASDEDLDTALRDLAVEKAQLEASKARLRSAEIVLDYTRIKAPISGVVAEVSTREGETVAADFSAPTFVTIIDLKRLEVLAYVDETDIGRIQVGQAASFTVDTYPGIEFKAIVNAIQPRAVLQNTVVNYVVRLDFEAGEGFILRPEMTAHVQLVVDEREDALTAPRNALIRRDGRQFVMVQRDGVWMETGVRTGWRSASKVEILSGVSQGDVIELNPKRRQNK